MACLYWDFTLGRWPISREALYFNWLWVFRVRRLCMIIVTRNTRPRFRPLEPLRMECPHVLHICYHIFRIVPRIILNYSSFTPFTHMLRICCHILGIYQGSGSTLRCLHICLHIVYTCCIVFYNIFTTVQGSFSKICGHVVSHNLHLVCLKLVSVFR